MAVQRLGLLGSGVENPVGVSNAFANVHIAVAGTASFDVVQVNVTNISGSNVTFDVQLLIPGAPVATVTLMSAVPLLAHTGFQPVLVNYSVRNAESIQFKCSVGGTILIATGYIDRNT